MSANRIIQGMLLGLVGMLAGCAMAQERGEWFTVAVAGHMSRPKLLDAVLTSSEPKVDVIKDAATGYTYGREDKLRVPEVFTLRWRAQGDEGHRQAVFRVRSQIPSDVLERLNSSHQPTHMLSLHFRVTEGQAECLWDLANLDLVRSGRQLGSGTVARGVIKP